MVKLYRLEISLKHPPKPVWNRGKGMQKRLKCSCKRTGCNPGTKMFEECPKPKIWYAAFQRNNQKCCKSLKVYKGEKNEDINANRALIREWDAMEGGASPKLDKPLKDVLSDYYRDLITIHERSDSVLTDAKGRIKANIIPLMGHLRLSEISQAVVRDYKNVRDEAGAAEGSIRKELRIIKGIVQLYDPKFILPEFRKFKKKKKEVKEALTEDQVWKVYDLVPETSLEFGKTYQKIFLLMALTGLDIGDAVSLEERDVPENCISKIRAKTQEEIKAHLTPEAKEFLSEIIPDESGRYFRVPGNRSVSTAIRRAFKKAKIVGNSKALRHFAATQHHKSGIAKTIIAQNLGHAPGSHITDGYCHGDQELLNNSYKGFNSGLLERVGRKGPK